MATKNPEVGSSDQILEEHRAIRRAEEELEDFLTPARAASPDWTGALAARATALLESLRPHFLAEEGGYFFQHLPVEAPRHGRAIERLIAEHAAILSTLTEIASAARTSASHSEKAKHELLGKAQRLLALARRHEAEETEILLSANFDDLGGMG